ncbi:hypothetical protein ACFL6N_01215, partial [Thermodesulfobacteriota bacterium]
SRLTSTNLRVYLDNFCHTTAPPPVNKIDRVNFSSQQKEPSRFSPYAPKRSILDKSGASC